MDGVKLRIVQEEVSEIITILPVLYYRWWWWSCSCVCACVCIHMHSRMHVYLCQCLYMVFPILRLLLDS